MSFLSGKWKSVAIADPKQRGPEFGWELAITPAGQCTVLTDARLRIYTKHVVAFSMKNGVLSFYSGEKGERYIASYDPAGPRLTITAPEIIGWTMSFIKSNDPIPELHALPRLPRTLRDAVTILYSELSEAEKENLLFSHYWEITGLHLGYGIWIKNRFRLWSGNTELLASCGSSGMHPDEAARVILEELAKEVRRKTDPELALNLLLQDRVLKKTLIPTASIDNKNLSDIGNIINRSIRDHIGRDDSYERIKGFTIVLEISEPVDTVFECGEFEHFFNYQGKQRVATVDQLLFALAGYYGLEEKRDVTGIRFFNRNEVSVAPFTGPDADQSVDFDAR